MRINTNVMALNAQNKLSKNQSAVEKSIQKLSSGFRINSAADDAAGLAISEKMRSQIRGLAQAESNAQDGISLIQTAEGALQQTTDILQRMRELIIKAQNTGVLTEDDRVAITSEMSTLRDEIDRIGSSTSFNSKKLLDGSLGTRNAGTGSLSTDTATAGIIVDTVNAECDTIYTISASASEKITITWENEDGITCTDTSDITMGATTTTGKIIFAIAGISLDLDDIEISDSDIDEKTIETKPKEDGERAAFKIGANTYSQDTLFLGIGDMTSTGLSKTGESKFTIAMGTVTETNECMEAIDYAIEKVSSQRATLGAIQNRMEYAINNLATTKENLTAAESRIRDVDMASEMVSYTKDNILNQAAMAMLAQANQQPQQILTLLQ